MASYLRPLPCANKGGCPGADDLIIRCEKCLGERYCSTTCQKADKARHQNTCQAHQKYFEEIYVPTWVADIREEKQEGKDKKPKRKPNLSVERRPVRHYFFGNMPAINMLNLSRNEGADGLSRDFTLLFAASGDLRNIIKTVVDLPEDYSGQCTIVFNDWDFQIVARNIILLLVALSMPDAEEAMLHLWYAASIPKSLLDSVRSAILPQLRNARENSEQLVGSDLAAYTFSFNNASVNLQIILRVKHWTNIEDFLTGSDALTFDVATSKRQAVTENPNRLDLIDFSMFLQKPRLRFSLKKYREDGMLLAWYVDRTPFDTPNPMFFPRGGQWPLGERTSPIDGWANETHILAGKDPFGLLYEHVRNILSQFCRRLKTGRFVFQGLNERATSIEDTLEKAYDGPAMLFDRIEVSNICDENYLGPKLVLETFAKLLKPITENMHATLLLLFMNPVARIFNEEGMDEWQEYKDAAILSKKFQLLNDEALKQFADVGEYNPEMIRRQYKIDSIFADRDAAFETYLARKEEDFGLIKGDLRMKTELTVVEKKWPLRITAESTRDEFDAATGLELRTCERYLEIGYTV